jgi:hypothetical protein
MTTMANVDALIISLREQFMIPDAPNKNPKRQNFRLPRVTDECSKTQGQSVPKMVKGRQESIVEQVENFMRSSVEDENLKRHSHIQLLPLIFREKEESISERVNIMPPSALNKSLPPTPSRSHIVAQMISEKDETILERVENSSSDHKDDSLAGRSQLDLTLYQAYEFVPRSPRPYIHSSSRHVDLSSSTKNKVPIIHPHVASQNQGVYRAVESPQRKKSKSLKRFFTPKEQPAPPVRRSASRLSMMLMPVDQD